MLMIWIFLRTLMLQHQRRSGELALSGRLSPRHSRRLVQHNWPPRPVLLILDRPGPPSTAHGPAHPRLRPTRPRPARLGRLPPCYRLLLTALAGPTRLLPRRLAPLCRVPRRLHCPPQLQHRRHYVPFCHQLARRRELAVPVSPESDHLRRSSAPPPSTTFTA